MADWMLIAAMPNISFQFTVESDYVAIVGENDDRYKAIATSTGPSSAILTKFSDAFGVPKSPSALLINKDAPKHLFASHPLIAFRNAAVLPELFTNRAMSLVRNSGAFGSPTWSDSFDLYPWKPSKDDDGFINANPSLLGWHSDVPSFNPQTSELVSPTEIYSENDKRLRESLLREWRFRFQKNRTTFKATQLFRSLEVAYAASRVPNANEASFHDYGIALSLWVSAFEILSYKRGKGSGLSTVIEMLDRATWESDELSKKKYVIKVANKDTDANLAQKLYAQLNNVRNDYMHGNPIRQKKLVCFQNPRRAGLIYVAPLLYRVALAAAIGKPERKVPANWGKGTGLVAELRRLHMGQKINTHLTPKVGWPFEGAFETAALGKSKKGGRQRKR